MTIQVSELEFHAVLVCDDVRREDNKKEILIGVYGSAVVVPALPAFVNLVFWMQATSARPGLHKFTFRVVNESDTEFLNVTGDMNVGNPHELGSLGVGTVYQAQANGKLFFQCRSGDSDWVTLRTVEVRKAKPEEASALGMRP